MAVKLIFVWQIQLCPCVVALH